MFELTYCMKSSAWWWWLKDHHYCSKPVETLILKYDCWVHCSLSRVANNLQQEGSISFWDQFPTLVVRGLIFLLPGRVSGPIFLLSGIASHHMNWKEDLKWHFTWKTQIDASNVEWKTSLGIKHICEPWFSNILIRVHFCLLSRVYMTWQQEGSISLTASTFDLQRTLSWLKFILIMMHVKWHACKMTLDLEEPKLRVKWWMKDLSGHKVRLIPDSQIFY